MTIVGEIPRHFPYVTRTLLDLHRRGQLPLVTSIEAEPEYGYATRITYANGGTRMTYGNDIGLNSGAACDVVKDKAYAKHFLERDGIACPRGAAFLLAWWAARIGPGMTKRGFGQIRTAGAATAYVESELGFPVYVKPVDGSQGAGVFRCDSADEIAAAMRELSSRKVRVAIVEEAVALPDYRLVVLRGDVISAYRRTPLTVVGDGRSTIRELTARLQREFDASGRDTVLRIDDERIVRCLRRSGLHLGAIPEPARPVVLHDVSNLSAGGTATDVTDVVAERWVALACRLARSFGLDFAGVDLACADICRDDAEYSVLEINAAPGLDHYANVGPAQEATVRSLYAMVLNAPPTSALG